ncbi:hypothetical protein DUI87_05232 [Hirundo rustica rustica]|uniref:Uncharacterized protein n=1 Tax=Hirundo rustica rustica TaxID=333673 RepID=A0A3M0KWF7_HIRRU|nr:hypothetical protein DUI87_05232 [Hirundo rustica rustica]
MSFPFPLNLEESKPKLETGEFWSQPTSQHLRDYIAIFTNDIDVFTDYIAIFTNYIDVSTDYIDIFTNYIDLSPNLRDISTAGKRADDSFGGRDVSMESQNVLSWKGSESPIQLLPSRTP